MRNLKVAHCLLLLTATATLATTALALSNGVTVLASLCALTCTASAMLAGHLWLERRSELRSVERIRGSLAEFRAPQGSDAHGELLSNLVRDYGRYLAEVHERHDAHYDQLQRYEFLAQHTDDLLIEVDSKGVIKYASTSMRQHLGFHPHEVVGRRAFDFLHEDDRVQWLPQLKLAAKERRSVLLEGRWLHRDGSIVRMEMSLRHAYGLNGHVAETIAMARNVESRSALHRKLEAAARTDTLTGLLNRAALVDELERLHAGCADKPFGLFLFDLDRFKQVNDSLGHAAGDTYLIETARRVSSVLRENDILARMGGDEFVALFTNATSEEALRRIADRIIEEVTKPFVCEGELLFPKTSIGVLLCNDPSLKPDELISRADRAMYVAKSQGGNLAVVYDASQADTLRKSFAVEQELMHALEEDRLAVQFQPIVDSKTKKPVLAEALVRMRGLDGGLIPPGHFIEVAEKSGLIFQVGAWVLRQACLHSKRIASEGHPACISVNVSPRQLMHVNYVESVERILDETGASPTSIVLEVTESAVMQDVARARGILKHLRALGFRLALDDFGSGYSSISMLKSLPFDILKIDRAFATDAEVANIGPSTLASIIDIGKSLSLTIIAEGIESPSQSLGLERLGCDLLQGYLFHRPLDPDAHLDVVKSGHAALVTGRTLKTTAEDVVLF